LDNYHGYDVDEAKRQLYSTSSGDSWQLTQIVTLVDSQTMTITYTLRRGAPIQPIMCLILRTYAILRLRTAGLVALQDGEGNVYSPGTQWDGTTTGTETGAMSKEAAGSALADSVGVASPTPAIVMQRYRMIPSKQGGTSGWHSPFLYRV